MTWELLLDQKGALAGDRFKGCSRGHRDLGNTLNTVELPLVSALPGRGLIAP